MATMQAAEYTLYLLAKLLSRSELAHSTAMKQALRDEASAEQYRAGEIARVRDAIQRYRVPVHSRTVLDVGCHDGALTMGLPALGASGVIGVDIDAAAIARASTRNPAIRFLVSAPDRIPLPDASIDTAIAYDVFEHVEHPAMLARELARVVRPDGAVLIGTWSWCHPFAPHLWSVMPVPWAHLVVSERTLLAACRRVYLSSWYVPDRHDVDARGQRKHDKYTETAIDRRYLNQYRIGDFERAFQQSWGAVETYPIVFGSAKMLQPLAHLQPLRDWLSGYVWFVLRDPNVHG